MDNSSNITPIEHVEEISTNSSHEIGLKETQALIKEAVAEMSRFRVAYDQFDSIKNKNSEAHQKRNNYTAKSIAIGILILFITGPVILIVGVEVGAFFWSKLDSLFQMDVVDKISEGSFLMSILLYLSPALVIFAILVSIFLWIYRSKRRKYDLAIAQGILTKEESEICDQCVNQMNASKANMLSINIALEHSVLPQDYHNEYAVNWIVKAMENKRADTLKEAINLYEQHMVDQAKIQTIQAGFNALNESISNIELNVW